MATLASGIPILQVAANPYVTAFGDPATASSPLTLAQAFNSLGTTVAPALGGMLILSGAVRTASEFDLLPAAEQVGYRAREAATVQGPYLVLAASLLCLALFIAFARLPRIGTRQDTSATPGGMRSLLQHRHLVPGAIGILSMSAVRSALAAS